MGDIISLRAQPQAGKGALDVPEEARDLLVDLDVRGYVLAVHNGGSLRISRKVGTEPPDLTAHDREQITRWKSHLLALVAYCREDH